MSKNLDSPQKRSISPLNRRESKISDQVVIDSSKLQERAMKAFTKLESILQSHQQRVASEKIRQRELEDIEKRADSLEEELKELFSHCREGWQKEILYRYDTYHNQRIYMPKWRRLPNKRRNSLRLQARNLSQHTTALR